MRFSARLRLRSRFGFLAFHGGSLERATDVVLDALATRSTQGFVAAEPLLARALTVVRDLEPRPDEAGRLLALGGSRVSAVIATDLWDFAAGRDLAERQVRLARPATGAAHRS